MGKAARVSRRLCSANGKSETVQIDSFPPLHRCLLVAPVNMLRLCRESWILCLAAERGDSFQYKGREWRGEGNWASQIIRWWRGGGEIFKLDAGGGILSFSKVRGWRVEVALPITSPHRRKHQRGKGLLPPPFPKMPPL